MSRTFHLAIAAGAAVFAAACSDVTGSSAADDALLVAFSSTPVGYGDLSSSYVGSGIAGVHAAGLWLAAGREGHFDRGGLMGGGISDHFIGGIGFGGRGGHRGPFGGGLSCAGSTFTNGRVVCPDETRNGLTIKRSAAYATASGAVQQAFDTLTTNTVNLRIDVAGTVTYDRAADTARGGHRPHHDGRIGRLLGDTATVLTASTTIASTSDRTVSGLAQGSTQRTVNGTSRGSESTTGTSTRGAFTATRLVSDTTRNLVVPVRAAGDTTHAYPTSGTVTRTMQVTYTPAGGTAQGATRREVVTYDGSATAKVTVTENGTTRNCTRALPRGRLVCG